MRIRIQHFKKVLDPPPKAQNAIRKCSSGKKKKLVKKIIFKDGLGIRIRYMRIRIQHFKKVLDAAPKAQNAILKCSSRDN
jgi:hypothetical protein